MSTDTTTVTENLVSPYRATKILNEILRSADVKEIPPQMMYQYAKKGYITSQIVNGKIYFDVTATESEKDFGKWMMTYLSKKGIVLTDETEETE